MAYCDVHVWSFDGRTEVTAYGGTRRQRGAAIGAVVRGMGLTLVSTSYSETYGFQSATYARYERA